MAEEHIKINPVPTKVKYSGNGVVREFPTGFAFFEDDNIVVYHNGVIINTGYSVTGVGETDGGVVTFDVAPTEGDKIVIIRKVAIERVTDFQEGGAFRAKNINDELDRQTAFCQQIQEEIDRCVKVEVTDDQTPEELLTEVYGKLDSATAVATDAILAAEQATIAAEQATTAVEEAKKQVVDTQEYVDNAKLDINNTVEAGKQEINTTIDEAQMNLSDTIEQAVEDVKAEAVAAAQEVIADAGAQATQIATDSLNAYITNNVTPTLDSAISTINTTKDGAVNELSSVLAADKSTLESYVDSTTANATVASNSADAAMEYANSASTSAANASTSATRSESAATRAETAAAQSSQASGKIIQLGFDGAIEDGKLVFKHAPSGVEVPYELLDDYEYEVDMLYDSTEELSSDLPMVVKNGANTITFVSALHRSADEPATISDMAPVMREVDGNYRWLFKAAYKITPAGKHVLLIYPVVASIRIEDITSQLTKHIVVETLPTELEEDTFYYIPEA